MPVTVRVEGTSHTLLPATNVTAAAGSVDSDGKPADACKGVTAAAALQDATHGDWTAGAYSHGLGYPVIGIRGESHPFTSAYYWALWIDGKPASTGICGAKLHGGDSILFFPQCSKSSASKCPDGLFSPVVLAATAPRRVKAGTPFTVKVTALSNTKGAPAPAHGATVSAGAAHAATDSSGHATLTLPHAGTYTVHVTAPDAVRDELKVHAS